MKQIVLLVTFIYISLSSIAQNTANDFVNGDDMVWYGLDFSHAKFVGAFDQGAGAAPASGSDLKDKYIPSWNMILLNEAAKYDLHKPFRKTNVYNDLSVVEKSNAEIDADNIMSYNSYKFDDADKIVNDVVSNFGAGDKKEGIGVLFIVESFDKTKVQASFYVAIFDIKTKKIIIKQQVSGEAGGFGLRNYWAKSIFNALRMIDKTYYKQWKNSYGK